jgi:hypothetical protein
MHSAKAHAISVQQTQAPSDNARPTHGVHQLNPTGASIYGVHTHLLFRVARGARGFHPAVAAFTSSPSSSHRTACAAREARAAVTGRAAEARVAATGANARCVAPGPLHG